MSNNVMVKKHCALLNKQKNNRVLHVEPATMPRCLLATKNNIKIPLRG